MLHELSPVLRSSTLFADASPSASTTLQITIVTGIVTIVVSLIGVWGTKTSRLHKEKPITTATSEDRFEAEIERLERICYEWDIDPKNGQAMKHRAHGEGGRHAGSPN